jgi:hypothetical protein
MIWLGITGHQSIPEAARGFVSHALEKEIKGESHGRVLWGVTSLAIGADQLFADLVLRSGGKLHVIIPSARYESTFDSRGLSRYQALLGAAAEVERLESEEPTDESFLAAGMRVVELCDTLLAVWDGLPSHGLGGTADVVKYAASSGRPVRVIWPTGVER